MGRLTRGTMVAVVATTVVTGWGAAAETLKVGVVGTTSDAPFFIAAAKGYFKDEGLDVDFVQFPSAAKMIAPLGTGELDVGGGATSAALYNAVGRGVNVKIVADKAKNTKGFGFQAIMVRKDLAGTIKSFKDLKGKKLAISAAGNSEAFLVDQAMRQAGLTIKDLDLAFLGFPQHPVAFSNKAIDASLSTEPTVTKEEKMGVAVKLAGVDSFYPNFQTAVTFYSGVFIQKKPEEAKKFMKALVRGMRFYRDNLVDGHLAGPQAQEIIDIMVKNSPQKDPQIYRDVVSNDVDPNGAVDEKSLRASLQFFKDEGQTNSSVTLDQVLDLSFAKAAAAELGPWKPSHK